MTAILWAFVAARSSPPSPGTAAPEAPRAASPQAKAAPEPLHMGTAPASGSLQPLSRARPPLHPQARRQPKSLRHPR
jgi:hypothetical protein